MFSFVDEKLIFGILGGLGLFLFGMKIMSEGLQKVAGNRMRRILAALTNNRVIAALVGLGVTAIIQSSSATTVMVVGFVNAGLMSLAQAIGVVLGANVGTTITAQLIAFKITHYALPAIGIGAGLKLFSKNKKWMYIGEILLGFGILFFGLSVMKHAFDPLKGSEEFRQLFMLVSHYKVLAVLMGAILTVVVQSSSATIGITIALAVSGLLSFEASVALILGENIGTTITANLAAIGTNLAARRTALAHFLFNLLGVTYMLMFFGFFTGFVNSITPGDPDFAIETQKQAAAFGAQIGDKPFIARHIANTHTLFNIINTLIFLPMVGILAKLATLLIRGSEEDMEFHLKYIDNRVLNTPPIAIGQARAETKRMAQISLEMLQEANQFLVDGDRKHLTGLEKKEEIVDLLQKEITDFLVALSQKSVGSQTSKDIASMMHMVNDLERVGDYCEKIWLTGVRKLDEKIQFTDTAIKNIRELGHKTEEFLAFIVAALERQDLSIFEKAGFLERTINEMEEEMRSNHIARLNTGECSVLPGLVFIDMLHCYEKIGDHTYNVTKAYLGAK